MDQSILQNFPLQTVPTNSGLEPATKMGSRYLVARDGLWREITLPWMTSRYCVAKAFEPMPYGELSQQTEFKFNSIPVDLVKQFVDEAKQACPLEIAAVMLFNPSTGQWRYARRAAISSSAAHIDYKEVEIDDDEYPVVDLHSHGCFQAFFSEKDDKDDKGSFKIALVVGNLDSEQLTYAMRLCCGFRIHDLKMDASGQLEGVSHG